VVVDVVAVDLVDSGFDFVDVDVDSVELEPELEPASELAVALLVDLVDFASARLSLR